MAKGNYSYLNFQARKETLLSAGIDQYEALVAVSVSLFEEFGLEESSYPSTIANWWMDARHNVVPVKSGTPTMRLLS
jgi:hypothetical protein